MFRKIYRHTLAGGATFSSAFVSRVVRVANNCACRAGTVMTSHVPRGAAAASRRAVLRGLTSAASALALCGCAGMAADRHFEASAVSCVLTAKGAGTDATTTAI